MADPDVSIGDETALDTPSDGLEQAKAELAVLTQTLQRLQAEFENYRKRVAAEQAQWSAATTSQIMKEILEVADTLEAAFGHKNSPEEFIKGIELVYARLMEILESHNIVPFDPLGELFDPRLHDALSQGKCDQPAGTILEVLQKGYRLGDRVLRHAKVKVAQ